MYDNIIKFQNELHKFCLEEDINLGLQIPLTKMMVTKIMLSPRKGNF